MFIGKTPTDTITTPIVFRGSSVRVEFSFPLVRRQSDPSHEPEWFSELSEVVDSLPDLIATFDRDGRLMMINTAGIDLLGYSEPSLKGLLISDLYPEPDAERIFGDALQQALSQGSWAGCAALKDAEGKPIETYQRWVAHRLHQEKTRAFTLVARRLSEPSAGDELRNRRESLAAMSMGFVHDLNNILGPIVAYAELAAATIDDGSKTARYVEQITRAAERGRALSARWAELARKREPKRSLVDIAKIASEIVGWLRVTRPDLRIELSCNDVVTTVLGDPVRLHQVVLNLAQNGVEALSDRAGSIIIRIDHARPDETTGGDYLRLEVRDDGRGIDEKIEARIFDPFFSTRTEGSGLGLNVSREIVLAHNGVIRLERSAPKGTTATVFLPLASDDAPT